MSGPRFRAAGFRVIGSSVFSSQELEAALAAFTGRELGSEDLVSVRNVITRLYVERGYVNSGAVIPDQDLADGVIEIRVIEGGLERIDLVGETRFRKSRLRSRVELGLERPLDVRRLERNLQLLQQDPRIERVHARLAPGERLGEAVLILRVEERSPYQLDLEVSNWAPVAFGAYRGRLTAAHENLTGIGDILDARLTVADGLIRVDGQYEFPLTRWGTTLALRGEYSDSEIVESPFDLLDIQTEYWSGRVFVEHPVWRSERGSLRMGLMGEWRRAETCFGVLESIIGCDEFSFGDSGAINGTTTVSVLRLRQDFVWRDRRQVFAARSTFSWGIPVLGARSGGVDPDGRFFAWLGQFQWARRFEPWGGQIILRADAQLVSDRLPSLERFPVGGHATVRGYRENQLVRDQGVVGSAELRVPLWRAEAARPILELAPFFDIGWSDNVDRPTPNPDYLASVGIGLRLAPTRRLRAEIYWGHQLKNVGTSGDLQDHGVQFRIGWDAF